MESPPLDALSCQLGVRFIYEKETTSTAEAKLDMSTLTTLADIPSDLLSELEQSLIRLDTDAVKQAIDKILPQAPSLGQELASMAGDLQFGTILLLIHTGADDHPHHHPGKAYP